LRCGCACFNPPVHKIGTPTAAPGDVALYLGAISHHYISPPNPLFNPLIFDVDKDVADLNKNTPMVTLREVL
jgi:hypothetical protein